jgi:hypothetical protein
VRLVQTQDPLAQVGLDILEEKSSQLKKDPGNPKQSGKTTNLDSFVNLAPTSNEVSHSNWILDLGPSTHVTGRRSEFASYAPHPPTHKETIQTTGGTYQPVIEVGTVRCTPSITLPSVLYVPSFPVNLVSMSSLLTILIIEQSLIDTIV